MKFRYFIVLSILSLSCFALQAQQSVKLSGTIIGSADSFDYAKNSCSITVNTKENAFDGNLNTIFASCQRSGGWVGMDLGEKHVITKVAYCPRVDEPNPRMLMGVFEGANQPDFGDAVPIYMITEAPQKGKLTEKEVNCSRAFRYIRYVGPNDVKCNLAELEFYGHKSQGDNSALFQTTNLPDIIIHTTGAKDIKEKKVYIPGTISVISENGTVVFTDSLDIRGRGNASWGFEKKPYRIKLKNKTNLLGLPSKAKKWTLISNHGDKTLFRNLLAFDLSQRFEMPYTPAGILVNLYLNGEYKGCYQLSDQIEVKEGRVDVEELKVSDTSGTKLTGGYLLEMDDYAYDDPDKTEFSLFTSARNRVPVTIKYPDKDDIVREQFQYIKSHFELLETALYSSNYKDPVNGYARYMDTQTFVKHFLVGEITGNTDTYWSTYMYKERGDDKFYFGPVWDFDIAYENDNRTKPVNGKKDWIYCSGGNAAPGVKGLVDRLLSDEKLYTDIRRTYSVARDKNIISEEVLLKVVDDYVEYINPSQELNFKRWPVLNKWVHMAAPLGSYKAEVDNVKNYIKNRIVWLDKRINYSPGEFSTSTGNTVEENILIWTSQNTVHLQGLPENSTIRINDIPGKLVSEIKTNDTYSTVDLPKGIYIVQIINGNLSCKTFKCIIP